MKDKKNIIDIIKKGLTVVYAITLIIAGICGTLLLLGIL